MNKYLCVQLDTKSFLPKVHNLFINKIISRYLSFTSDDKIKECYQTLNLPQEAQQADVKQAFIKLAKRFHPDSGTSEACMEKFVKIENAFRVLTKYITGKAVTSEIDNIMYDIRHVAPQHRQYLSYEGIGHGTPYQRQKQWTQARAQKASENVMEHRISKSIATDRTLLVKEQYSKKHDIKTKYGFDRLVEDLIQEAMSKGEFENLSGIGKPLADQNRNPYVDFTTQKLNEVMINNGFTPEWITLNKEIDEDINLLKQDLREERQYLGPYPLSLSDEEKWLQLSYKQQEIVESINKKIVKYNLIVPLINKQKFFVDYPRINDDILKGGLHSMKRDENTNVTNLKNTESNPSTHDDFVGLVFKMFSEVFSFGRDKKNVKTKVS